MSARRNYSSGGATAPKQRGWGAHNPLAGDDAGGFILPHIKRRLPNPSPSRLRTWRTQMARGPTKAKSPPVDHNEAEILDIIKRVTDENISLARKRKAINDQILANYSEVKALNIDMTAYKAAARRYEMDADVRHDFDRSITQVNQALGIPVQPDLFPSVGNISEGVDDNEYDLIPAGA